MEGQKPEGQLRPGEKAIDHRTSADADLQFIGSIRTPWKNRADCPRQGSFDGPLCSIEVDEIWQPALAGLEAEASLDVFYWLHQAARNLVLQMPRGRSEPAGTFPIRSPNRPNPIGVSTVRLERITGNRFEVRGLDCLDGTPLIDIKPHRRPRFDDSR